MASIRCLQIAGGIFGKGTGSHFARTPATWTQASRRKSSVSRPIKIRSRRAHGPIAQSGSVTRLKLHGNGQVPGVPVPRPDTHLARGSQQSKLQEPMQVPKMKANNLVLSIVGPSVLMVGVIISTSWVLSRRQQQKSASLAWHVQGWYPELRQIHRRSSIAIATTITSNYFYIPFSIRWEQYANSMGYDWYRINLDNTELRFPAPHWHKISLMYELLQRGYEYVLFTDGDTVLMQPGRRIEEFLNEAARNTQLWISADLPGVQTIINTGLMIVRNGTWSREMLKYVMRESRDLRIDPHRWPAEQGSVHRWIQVHPKPFFHMYPYGERFQVFSTFEGNPVKEAEDVREKKIWVLHFPAGYSDSRHIYARSIFDYMQGKYPVGNLSHRQAIDN